MKLRAPYSSVHQAWEAYLEFSPASRAIVETRSDISLWAEPSESLMEWRRAGRWHADLQMLKESGLSGFNALREWKTRELVVAGFVEFATDISVAEATATLSDMADFVLHRSTVLTLREMEPRFRGRPSTFAVLGLGKLGGCELNYHSDIDVVFIYGEEEDWDGDSLHQIYNRVASRVTQEIAASSQHGQLYRIDLRLRPEGDKGPMARSLESCENYYAAFGEMWERLAMLKARLCAGNKEVGYEFQHMIQPFCYARDMIPELLSEIAHLKKRTEKEIVGDDDNDLNVKLGRGGIRDLEFYVQGLQLLHGARHAYLQKAGTLKALEALRHGEFISRERYDTLCEAYQFWRVLEHRIQIVDHRQTHSLPRDQAALASIARSMGFASADELWDRQMQWRKTIRAVYDEFYDGLEATMPSTVMHEFRSESFAQPHQAERDWRSLAEGSAEFHLSRRTSHAFHRMSPHLAHFLFHSLRPDLALAQFASFVRVYGSRSMLYESLANSPKALEILIRLFDSSQYLGEVLRAAPHIFEDVARGGLDDIGTRQFYIDEMNRMLGATPSPSTVVRLYKREQMVRVALRWLLNLAPLDVLQMELTDLAEACLHVGWEFLGRPPVAVIGMGKLGGQELSFGADLDVLWVGEDNAVAQSWAKFMTEHTADGALFQMDARLRPFAEGNLSHPVETYANYYRQSAQLWEIQSLSKARWAAGDEELGKRFMDAVMPVWRTQSERADLVDLMVDMRRRIEEGRCKSKRPELEFKTGAGGLIDIEFACQAWQMRKQHFQPNTLKALNLWIEEGYVPAKELKDYYQFMRMVEAWLRFDLNISVSNLPQDDTGLAVLAKRCGFAKVDAFMESMATKRKRVREIFEQVMGTLLQ